MGDVEHLNPNTPSRGDETPAAASDPQHPPFESILFERTATGEEASEPDYFGDLNLDRLVESLTAGREQYELKPFFYRPLHEVSAVHYRHEVLRELERAELLEPVEAFVQKLVEMREHHEQIAKLHYGLQKQAWFLDAVAIYCDAVRMLAERLAQSELSARGLRGLAEYLAGYVESGEFGSLVNETRSLKQSFDELDYAVHIHGARVTVSNFEGEPDYSAEVEETFAKFKQGAVKSYLVRIPDFVDMNHVEAHILELVAKLNPELFGQLAGYCVRHRDYLDPTIARFDREVQFYLAYLDLVNRLRASGMSFCYPHVSTRSKETRVEATFDIALGNKLVGDRGVVVTNDFFLEGNERVFVITGPNNGGKTTFARMFGQLHYLASLGLLVPGSSARLYLPDTIFTHFEREEDIETLRGKFEDELVRVHQILEEATEKSVIVMNESFNSTTLNDALFVGSEVMQRILELGCLGVYVTFVDEIASLGEATVSMVSQIVPENPAERTFKVLRKPADGLAYASAIADKYGLSYDRLMERIEG